MSLPPANDAPASKVRPLKDNQLLAVDPQETVWLSASAGTGKTQVLSARVLRLLLRDRVSPSQILCLTFTKAGAAEMAVRVNEVLADWVRMREIELGIEIGHIGLAATPEIIAHARTLFASVLDCPGGGLRIDTIHAFSQWLLAAFPEEAGLSPGTRAMEDRDRSLLAREVLSGLLLDAEAQGDAAMLDALSTLSLRMTPAAIEVFLLRCASAHDVWDGLSPWAQGDLAGEVKRLVGLRADAGEADLVALCSDDVFDVDSLRLCLSAYSQWNVKTGKAGQAVIGDWLAATAEVRLATQADLFKILFTQKDTIKDSKSLIKFEEFFCDAAASVLESMLKIRELQTLLNLAAYLTPALTLGRAFARRWQEAKAREGLIDFDDQIRQAAALLQNKEFSAWIRYKLDRQFDHILVDEAQDTNEAQWDIIHALSGEFFAGEGQRDTIQRTLFVVGDTKQAIFRFQGTSPDNFARAKKWVELAMGNAAANADQLRDGRALRKLLDLDLGNSFRTAAPILEFVDKVIDHVGREAMGVTEEQGRHVGQEREGIVTLWQPVTGLKPDEDAGLADNDNDDGPEASGGEPEDKGEETWLSRQDRALADRIARQVAEWLDPHGPGLPLIKDHHRRARAGDVMILVRKRAELAGLIVARLYAHGVPVAGVDRLRLGAPLAVKDLVAALRFAVQPFDNLNLAALLVSPLFGWSQEQLLEHGYRGERTALWEHLRGSRQPVAVAAVSCLLELLRKADYDPPQATLHWLLVGPWDGRRKLVARLGLEANDPIEELLNAAHTYAMSDTPSLIGFLHWFDAGDGELKREAESGGDMVRVMTVHGSKGLQSPIVILADATSDPTKNRPTPLGLEDPRSEAFGDKARAYILPLPGVPKEEQAGRLRLVAEQEKAAELEQHWRLLYVAMTRAEEALFIGGALKRRQDVPENSWYAKLEQVIGEDRIADPLWGHRREYGCLPPMPPRTATALSLRLPEPVPSWALTRLSAEPRPSRPLAPSSLGEDDAPDPPHAPGQGGEAARRGTLIHRLLERLPEVAASEREPAAMRWLARAAADLSAGAHAEMASSAVRVLDQNEWADLFSAQALAEVPIAALVGDRVVAGTIDRLLVTPAAIHLVDFKTARRPPATLSEVPVSILRQMAAYVAALEATYPGRAVRAALLYTQTPLLIELPHEVIAAHKPQLSTGE